MLPWLLAGAGIAKGVTGAYGAEQQRKAQKRGLQGQLSALQNLANVTPSERAYVSRRRQIIAEGDPLLKEQFGQQIGTIRQQGQFMRQRVQGQAIQQGLEKSIVAQELRRRVDKDVLTSVADQARQMAMANRQAKRQAELEIEGMGLKTDARKQEIAYKTAMKQAQIDAIPEYGWNDRLVALAGMGIGGLEGYASGLSLEKKLTGTGSDWEDLG